MKKKPLAWKKEDNHCIRCTSHAGNFGGYPRLSKNGKFYSISRIILGRKHGKLNSETVARHTCDNPWCINPDHLVIGSLKDNAIDMVVRGRHALAKLSVDDIIPTIRQSKEKNRRLAHRFGVSETTISEIKSYKVWKHVK